MSPLAIISSSQIKAARAILDWQQDELAAKSNLSPGTIRNLEKGKFSANSAQLVKDACEQAGLEFIENDGVRRRSTRVHVYEGHDSRHHFFNDLMTEAHKGRLPVLCSAQSFHLLEDALGHASHDATDRLEQLCNVAEVRCLLRQRPKHFPDTPSLQCRLTTQPTIDAASYLICDDVYYNIIHTGRRSYTFIAYRLPQHARDYRHHFLPLWESSTSIQLPQ
ncbi:MAG: helix-turn-helix transcriptional regulator [Alphaproteobacteria bacterium]|nr:helix-turn-helix transcriptional regulator [Alphaproteobacteria bacterium]